MDGIKKEEEKKAITVEDIWTIRALIEKEKEKASKALNKLADDTDGWSVPMIIAGRIPEETAALSKGQESLFLIGDKLDEIEGLPPREIAE